MSTKRVRSIHDFSRFGIDVEIACACGHAVVRDRREIVTLFSRRRWPTAIELACRRFRCSRCGRTAVRIGPMRRD